MLFYDANRNGGVYGTYTDPTLATLQAGSYQWSNGTSHDYSYEVINVLQPSDRFRHGPMASLAWLMD